MFKWRDCDCKLHMTNHEARVFSLQKSCFNRLLFFASFHSVHMSQCLLDETYFFIEYLNLAPKISDSQSQLHRVSLDSSVFQRFTSSWLTFTYCLKPLRNVFYSTINLKTLRNPLLALSFTRGRILYQSLGSILPMVKVKYLFKSKIKIAQMRIVSNTSQRKQKHQLKWPHAPDEHLFNLFSTHY